MAKALFTILFTFSFFSGIAQKDYSNSIKIGHGGFHTEWHPAYNPFAGKSSIINRIKDFNTIKPTLQTIQAYYERRIYKNIFAGLGYMQWKAWGSDYYANGFRLQNFRLGTNATHGTLFVRAGYKMTDAYAFYRFNLGHYNHHHINAGAGLTYCWGRNSYIDWISVNGTPPADAVYYNHSEKVHYWGFVPYLSYDFWFIRNRINVGPDFRARFYAGRPPAEYDVSIHLGVNF